MEEAEAALAKALSTRKAYATDGAYELCAPLLTGDPPDAPKRVRCALIERACVQGGMLRMSLTEKAIFDALPDERELCIMEGEMRGLLDVFAERAHGLPDAFLEFARLCIVLRKPPLGPGAATRELLWLGAQVFSRRRLAPEKLLRKLGPALFDLSARPDFALRYCRAALGMLLLETA